VTAAAEAGERRLRLDKWLWYARFHKSRTLAAVVCSTGRIRLNGHLVNKAHQMVRPGDVLTFPQGKRIRVIRVLALGARRGPAAEARVLYEDVTYEDLTTPEAEAPPARDTTVAFAVREPGQGRPSKAERRALNRLRGGKPGADAE
jgi:ribosome-associated heat shock protein Hsp15